VRKLHPGRARGRGLVLLDRGLVGLGKGEVGLEALKIPKEDLARGVTKGENVVLIGDVVEAEAHEELRAAAWRVEVEEACVQGRPGGGDGVAEGRACDSAWVVGGGS